jgi:hypothetical protein
MTINKGNIEAYLLDYLEGNLDPVMTAELMAFLSENPEYEQWIPSQDDVDNIHLSPSEKAALRKDFSDIAEINELNFEEFCIAHAEGILSEKNEEKLNAYLSIHPENKQVPETYQKLHLHPDLSIVFPGREDLKKPVKKIFLTGYVYLAAGIAAAILLVFMLLRPVHDVPVVATRQIPEYVPKDTFSAPKATEPLLSSVHQKQIRVPEKVPADTVKQAVPVERNEEPVVALEPVSTRELASLPIREPGISKTSPRTVTVNIPRPAPEPEPSTGQVIASLAKKVNIWKAADAAVTGFNYLTESRLSISKTVDENGKVTRFGLVEEDRPYPADKTK